MKSFVIVLLFICAVCAANAQTGSYNNPPADLGYPPPAGWTFIKRIDSTDRINTLFYSKGNNLLLAYQKIAPIVNLYSTNEGVTWDTLRFTWLPVFLQKRAIEFSGHPFGEYDSISKTYYECVHIITGTKIVTLVLNRKLNKGTVYITSDFGRTVDEFSMDDLSLLMIGGSRYIEKCFNHPTDTNRFFIKLSNQLGFNTLEYLWQTTNGGVTWRYVRMPNVPNDQKYKINSIMFHSKNSNDWWQVNVYTDIIGTQSFETRNGGETYRWIPPIGVYDSVTNKLYGYGLWGYPEDNTRRALYSVYADTLYYGNTHSKDSNFKSKQLITATPRFNDSTYRSSLQQDWTIKLWEANQDTLLHKYIAGYFPIYDNPRDAYLTATFGTLATPTQNSIGKFGIFHTTDDGEIWSNLLTLPLTTYNNKKLGCYFSLANIDTVLNVSYIAVKVDYDYIYSNHLDIWKKENFVTKVETENNSILTPTVFPIPANNIVRLQLPELHKYQTLHIINILGQIVYTQTMLDSNTTSYSFSISDLPSGYYSFKLEQFFLSTTIPFIISH